MSKADRIKRGGLVCKDPHLTKQSFKDQCDINRVLDKAKHGASLSHLANYQGDYGDFSHFTADYYENALNEISRAQSIFNDLPSELRQNEFQNNVGVFFEKVNDPAYADKLEEIFPAMAAPGRQFPQLIGKGADQLPASKSSSAAAESTAETPVVEPSGDPEAT